MTFVDRSPKVVLVTEEDNPPEKEEDVRLTAEISGGIFYLRQIPSAGGFTATIRDGVFYLTPPPTGNKYKAEIKDGIFYLREV